MYVLSIRHVQVPSMHGRFPVIWLHRPLESGFRLEAWHCLPLSISFKRVFVNYILIVLRLAAALIINVDFEHVFLISFWVLDVSSTAALMTYNCEFVISVWVLTGLGLSATGEICLFVLGELEVMF